MLVRGLFGLAFALGVMAADPALDRAKTLYDQTNYEESLKALSALPESGAVLRLRGRNFFMQNDFRRASELLERAVKAEPNSAEGYLWLGRAYGRRAETSSFLTAPAHASKARQNFERAVELDPKNSEALGDLFEYYLQAPGFLGGGHDRAAALIDRIATLDPAEKYFAQARLAEEKKDWNQAELQLRRAAELAPNQIGRLIDLAKFFAKRGKPTEAEAAFVRAAQINPDSPKLLIERAETYVEQGQRLGEARKLLERYLKAKLTPEDRPREEARKLLEKVAAAKG
ncbi:MAG: tetratricopeptide repeat protein [Bryobacteraceae bacterium]|nr:tetratricopeptide repeat protein [Bryobacteraceae bacterium]